ncbi:MAG: bifunctional homocysteine S-methyltransferase/methylenetetrahydrofolate reductase [Candidatus Obscuribacterales bacterium]|nr:bifunctional homocysteine S-methyltransferase/methylenetetrahydrofolate reductase [Candidatus Obscuribacterales bacterium]
MPSSKSASQSGSVSPFIKAVKERPLLADGGIGTLLYSRGASPDASFEHLNLTNKDLVQEIHVEYLNAGAEIITTNSFGANKFKLANFGLEKDVWNINVWAAKVARNAREIAGIPAFIAGSVGPTGRLMPPIGDTGEETLFEAFREQMDGLLAGGVDLFTIETMSSIEELTVAVRAARSICDLPVIAQVSFSPEGHTFFGITPEDVSRLFDNLGKDAPEIIGINCGAGPGPVFDALLKMTSTLARRKDLHLLGYSSLPNAGQPSMSEGHFKYVSPPDYCASYVDPYIRAGSKVVGGCCGTTPAHISAMRKSMDRYIANSKPHSRSSTLTDIPAQGGGIAISLRDQEESEAQEVDAKDDSDAAEREPLRLRLQALKDSKEKKKNDFFVSVELDPPKGAVTKKLLKAAAMLYESGADSINVGDSPMARVRMSSLASCQLISNNVGIETIIHFTTRDRNLMGIQADLLGCQALGIRNILALTGDPPALGNYAHATAVYDVDSIGLIRIISQLNQGKDIAGNTIGKPTNLSIGCALNCTHENRKLELDRFKRKLEAGAHFVMTQPIYQVSDLSDFLDQFGDCPVPILVGIMPLHSSKHAEYLHNEVPGISIPDKIRAAMAKAGDQGARIGLELAEALLEQVRDICQGTYLVPSFGRYEDMCDLTRRLKQIKSQSESVTQK